MDILILSGFLGSGKTTLLLRIARDMVDSGMKVAIIENEIGKIGVDNQTIAAEGLTVKELFSGCVCCSLRHDLVTALLEMERAVTPDVVIIEPSGVAGPHHLLDALVGYGGSIDRRLVIYLIDAVRAKLILQKPLLPIVAKGIEVADLILVNKADGVSPAQLRSVATCIGEIRPDTDILCVSALTGSGLELLPERFERMLTAPGSDYKVVGEDDPPGTDADAAVFAEKFVLAFAPPLCDAELRQRMSALLSALTHNLEQEGCTLIGHVKAILKDQDKAGYLLMSVTEFDTDPVDRGKLGDEIRHATLTLNAIVFGVDSLMLACSARELVKALMAECTAASVSLV